MNTDNLLRRYWAAGYHFSKKDSQLEKFINQGKWQIAWSEKDQEGDQFYRKLADVKIGDFFALKSLGGKYDLTISALGIVVDTKDKSSGVLSIKWLKREHLYKGKAPKGEEAGNWFGTLLEIKRPKDIAEIFEPLFKPQEEEIRAFTSDSDAFDFWKDEREDIYQDYLKIS
ncbi:MAG: hypothetical protein AAF849_02610 [Bacteroidota bacterium]